MSGAGWLSNRSPQKSDWTRLKPSWIIRWGGNYSRDANWVHDALFPSVHHKTLVWWVEVWNNGAPHTVYRWTDALIQHEIFSASSPQFSCIDEREVFEDQFPSMRGEYAFVRRIGRYGAEEALSCYAQWVRSEYSFRWLHFGRVNSVLWDSVPGEKTFRAGVLWRERVGKMFGQFNPPIIFPGMGLSSEGVCRSQQRIQYFYRICEPWLNTRLWPP